MPARRVLLCATLALAPLDAALACSQLKPWVARRVQELHETNLLSADRVIEGRWVETKVDAERDLAEGRIEYVRHGRPAVIEASTSVSVNMCGLAGYPVGPSTGTFYLRRGFVFHYEPVDPLEVRSRRIPGPL